MTAVSDQRAIAAGIPVRWVTRTPEAWVLGRGIALWLPYLGGTKDVVLPVLERLARLASSRSASTPGSTGTAARNHPSS